MKNVHLKYRIEWVNISSDRHPRTCKYFYLTSSPFEHRKGVNVKKIEEAETELQKLKTEVDILKVNLVKHFSSLYDTLNKITNKSNETTESISVRLYTIEEPVNCQSKDYVPDKCEICDQEV